MSVAIDGAGRIVIPKAIRDRLGLRAGDALELEEHDSEIVLRPPERHVHLVPTDGGLLTAAPDADLPGLGPDDVRELLERTRR
jgi:AbrB family looped-hinge helix DNA binding protein